MASGIDKSREDALRLEAQRKAAVGRPVGPALTETAAAKLPASREGVGEFLQLDRAALLIGCAALTLFSALALLGTAVAAAGLVGLLGRAPDTSVGILAIVDAVSPAGTARAMSGAVDDLVQHKLLAFALLTLGLLGSVAAGDAYRRSFRWSLAVPGPGGEGSLAHDRPPGTTWLVTAPAILAMALLSGTIAAAILLTGPLARAVAGQAGIGDLAVDLWEVFKWPLAGGFHLLLFGALSAGVRVDRPEPPWETLARWAAVAAWVVALGAFTFYLAAFDSFADSYGALGAAALSLLWLALFAVLYLALPLRRTRDLRPLAYGALAALALWAPASAALAFLIAHLGPLAGLLAAGAVAVALPAWLWSSNLGLLAGSAVRRRLELEATGPEATGPARPKLDSAEAPPPGPHPGNDLPTERGKPMTVQTPAGGLVRAVGRALGNEPAHDALLSVIPAAPDTPPGGLLNDLERDVTDWGFTFGVAWAVARSHDPFEDDEIVAERALAAAHQVFGEYMGNAAWAQRIAAERDRSGPDALAGELLPEGEDDPVGGGYTLDDDRPPNNGASTAAAPRLDGLRTGWRRLMR